MVGVVDDSVEDGVGDRGFADDLHQVASAFGGEALEPAVVENQQVDPDGAPQQAAVPGAIPVAGQFGDQLGDAR